VGKIFSFNKSYATAGLSLNNALIAVQPPQRPFSGVTTKATHSRNEGLFLFSYKKQWEESYQTESW
jgi:hypothetical protein